MTALNPYPQPPQWTSFTLHTQGFLSYMIVLESKPASSRRCCWYTQRCELVARDCLFASALFLRGEGFQNRALAILKLSLLTRLALKVWFWC